VGPLVNVEGVLRSLNCEPGPVFETIGANPAEFRNSDTRISFTTGSRLIATCVEATGCEHFGLLLGQWFLTSHLGLPGTLAQSAPDVVTALRNIVTNLDLHDQGAVATLEISDRYTTFGYAINLPNVAAVEQIYDLSITNMCGIMRSLCGLDWCPKEIQLSRAQPENMHLYTRFFRAPIMFNTLTNAIIFPNKYLFQPLPTADLESHELLIEDARRLHETMPDSVSANVRNTLRSHLPGGANTAAAVASELGLHERTLHRRLQLESTSFRKLLDQVRQSTSQHYLAGTALSIGDIGMALGYGSTGAFDHAFRRWHGVSPRQWRQSH